MPLEIIRNDITLMQVDAIVSAANSRLTPEGGVNGAIHRAAGPELLDECRRLGGCRVGQAKLTRGYDLPSKYVIHTVGPVWQGGGCGEEEALASCYRNALGIAAAQHLKSIAFPLISAGSFGYPSALALRVATDTIGNFLLHQPPDDDIMVYLVVFTRENLSAGSKLFADIRQHIDDQYVDEHFDYDREKGRSIHIEQAGGYEIGYPLSALDDFLDDYYADGYLGHEPEKDWPVYSEQAGAYDVCCTEAAPDDLHTASAERAWADDSLEAALRRLDESFSEMILRRIKEKGMKNAECYRKANIDKKLFSKIINSVEYRPKKATVLALAVALELSLKDTRELLGKAGYALSHSYKFDIIIEYFIMHKRYDIFEINEMLYEFDQPLLGGAAL